MIAQPTKPVRPQFPRIVLSALLLIGAVFAISANAATLTVTTTVDELDNTGTCADYLAEYTAGGTGLSLREALCVTRANADTANTVTLPAGTYTLALGTLWAFNGNSDLGEIKELTINGGGTSTTVIEANALPDTATQRIIAVERGTLTLRNMTLRHGRCASNCVILGDTTSNDGGAIYNSGTLTVDRVHLTANSTVLSNGGAIANLGNMTVINSTFESNSAGDYGNGGAIHTSGPIANISNNTFYSNSTYGGNGGAISISNSGNLTNNTLSGNFTTVSGEGAGIYNDGTLLFANNIIANSTGAGDCYSDFGTIATNNRNLIEDNTCNPALSGDPNLGPLANNGGPTETMALLELPTPSPAIDAGDNGACPLLDQRGASRPQGAPGAVCDIGAYETPGKDHFVTTWKTDNPGVTDDNQVQIPMVGGPYDVDTNNDGIFEFFDRNGPIAFTYNGVGTVRIRIRGAFDSIRFVNGGDFGGDKDKLLSIDQWGTNPWVSMNSAFYGATNLQVPATDTPDFAAVADFESIFDGATLANPDTSGWNTSSATNMRYMFWNAKAATPDTSNWDTSKVASMYGMFAGADLANPDTSGWVTTEVTDMTLMFANAISANPDTSSWDTAKVGKTVKMFEGATAANPDVSGWDVTALLDATDMFKSIKLHTSDYESLLINWSAQVLQPGVVFSGGNSTYCSTEAIAAKAVMEALPPGWVITDGGVVCDEFVTTWYTYTDGVTGSSSILIPMVGGPYDVDWGDGAGYSEFGLSGPSSHDYGVEGDYTVRIRGSFDSIRFDNGGDKEKILSIDQWGTNPWVSMNSAFYGATVLEVRATDTPDFAAVTDFESMFENAVRVNPDTSGWDTSKVTSMAFMFRNASSANPDTSGWDTSMVTSMRNMFDGAVVANPDTSGWNTSLVNNMEFMFRNASSANPDVSGWDVTSLEFAEDMFLGVTMSTGRYERLLVNWNAQLLKPLVNFNGGNSVYCSSAAVAARANMQASDTWLISDGGQVCNPADEFVTSWKTDNPGQSGPTSIVLPMVGGPYDVDWGDGAGFSEFGLTGLRGHVYDTAGAYTIRVRGLYDSFEADFVDDEEKLVSLDQWGTNRWSTMNGAFTNAINLETPATDTPDFSAVTSMNSMFFKAPLADPDTSNWDTSSVTSMRVMFLRATSANPDTSRWDTSEVTTMAQMFKDATAANPDTSNWDTSKVNSMNGMFSGAVAANPDTSNWDTSKVTDMAYMFSGATSARPRTSNFDVSLLVDATAMFQGVTLPTGLYDALLVNWGAQILNSGVPFSAGGSKYCSDAAATARASMVAADSWTITDAGQLCNPADDFVSSWSTIAGQPSTSLLVPMVGGPYDVDWGDGAGFSEFGLSGPSSHDYGADGLYIIRIRGSFDTIRFNNEGDKEKILSIDQWGTTPWVSMNSAFRGASNLQVPATDTPDFAAVTDFEAMFRDAVAANPDTSGWDTSRATTMRRMFYGAVVANPDTSGWNTSLVNDMAYMFYKASSANPDTSGWDTSRVTNMSAMFFDATSANPDTSQWDTSSVKSMSVMFLGATSANPDTSQWDTSMVTDMGGMFAFASSANPDTSGWDTSNVENMFGMFREATSAEPDTSGWDVTSLERAGLMFAGVTLPTELYDALLINWNAQFLRRDVTFDGGNSKYCAAAAIAARANMESSKGWVITDGGECEGSFTIGGNVSGLLGSGLVLQNKGEALPIAADGPFVFTVPVENQSNYDVSVQQQPPTPPQSCTVANGSGTVDGANVNNVIVTCAEFVEEIFANGFEPEPE